MPLIKPDLSSVGPIKEGVYRAKIISVTNQVSKKGNDMIVPKFEIDVDGKVREKDTYLNISGPGARGFMQLLRATGFEKEAEAFSDTSLPQPEFDSDWLVGQEVMVNIQPDMYQGEASDKIAGFLKV